MRSLIFVLLVACLPNSVCAEMIKFSSPGAETYADPNSIKKNGGIVQLELINDKKEETVAKTTGKPYKSLRVVLEVNCSSGEVRSAREKYYSDNMARGNAYADLKISNPWKPAKVGTIYYSLMELACEKGAYAKIGLKGRFPIDVKEIRLLCSRQIGGRAIYSIEAFPAVDAETVYGKMGPQGKLTPLRIYFRRHDKPTEWESEWKPVYLRKDAFNEWECQ